MTSRDRRRTVIILVILRGHCLVIVLITVIILLLFSGSTQSRLPPGEQDVELADLAPPSLQLRSEIGHLRPQVCIVLLKQGELFRAGALIGLLPSQGITLTVIPIVGPNPDPRHVDEGGGKEHAPLVPPLRADSLRGDLLGADPPADGHLAHAEDMGRLQNGQRLDG